MSLSSAAPAVSSPPSQLSHPAPMLSALPSPTQAVDLGIVAQEDTTIPAQSSASPASPSPPALMSPSPPVAPHRSDSLGPRTMRTLALGAVTTVGLAALAPLTVAGTRVAGDGVFNLTLALAAVRHAAESVREQSRRAKQNKKTAFQLGDKAVAVFNALVAAEGAMPLGNVITNAERIMRLFGDARDQFHRTETASRIRLPHGRKNADEIQKILDEADTILGQLKLQGSNDPTSSRAVLRVQPGNPLPVKSTVLDSIELVLETTMNASDNFLPPLKTAAQTALQLLRRFKSYRSNVAEIEVVMQLIVDMLERIRADTVQHVAASETLMDSAQRLLSVVEGTLQELQQLEAASGVEQILSVPTVAAILASTRVKINDAIRDYQTSVATWTAGAVHRIGKSVEMLVSLQHAAVSASLITRLPPPLPHVFHGREAEIALARDQILNHQPARIPILGAGGIGKTSLALAILHNADIIAHFADQRLFLACDSAPDTDAVVNYLLRMLQLDVSGRDPWDALLSALNSTITLLILDNFETVYAGSHRQKADLLLQRLAACSRLTLILTMRGASLPKSIKWSLSPLDSFLQPLSPHSAQSAFIDLVGRELSIPEHSAMVTLLARVDYMPLAIVLLAHLAADGLSPVDLLPGWDKEHAQLISGEPEQGRLYSIQASVQLSIDSIPKSAAEALPLLSVCSHLADGLYAGTQASLVAVFKQPISLSADVLQRLALVYVGQHGELRMLSPIRHYVSPYYPVDSRRMDCLRTRYLDLAIESDQPMDAHFPVLSALVSTEVQNLTAFLEEEIQLAPNSSTVEAVVAFSWFLYRTIPSPALATALLPHVKSSADALKLMNVLVLSLQSTAQYSKAMQIATQMRAQATEAQDLRNIALATQHLGDSQHMLDNYPTAKKFLQEAHALFGGIGDHLGQARCMHSLGEIERMLDNYPTAKCCLQEAQKVFEGVGNCVEQAQCMHSLGEIERMLDNYPTAKCCLQEAQKLFEGISDGLGQAQCMQSLGEIEHTLSNYPTAKSLLKDAQALFEGVGNRLGQTQCIQYLGDIERMLSNLPTAKSYLQEAQNMFEEIGDRRGRAQCMQSLADIERMHDNYLSAKTLLQDAQTLFEGVDNRLGQAQCMKSLGQIECMLNNYPAARSLLDDAQTLFEGVGNRLGQAQCMQFLGDIERMTRNYLNAKSLLQEAQSLFERIGDRLGQAQCMQTLGDIEHMIDNYTTARSYQQEAQTLFEGIGDRLGQARCMQSLGEIEHVLNNYTTARSYQQEAQNLFAGIGDRLGQAQCMQSLGDIEHMLDNYTTARSCLQEAQSLFEGIGERLGQAQCMQFLGNIERMTRNYLNAKSLLQEAQSLFEGIGNCLGQARCMQSLGNIERMLNNYPAARSCLQEAQNLFEGIGDRLGQAQCMRSLSDIEHMTSNYSSAKSLLQEAHTLFEGIGDRLGQAQCMQSLSDIERGLSNYSSAQSLLEDAQTLFEGIGDRLGQAQCMQSLGDIEYMLDNYPSAQSLLEDARTLFEGIGDRLGQAQCRQSLGDIEHKLNNCPSARSLFQEAQILFEEIGSHYDQAYCMLSLGYLEKDLDDYTHALQYFTDARAIYVTIEGQADFVDDCDENIEELHELMQTDQ